jgi:Tol biopolymer transport system component
MSPEQVRAQPSDSRSDIFSFGATLYEMLSGQQPFAAETMAQTMSAVIEKDPPSLPDTVPPSLRSIVERCLRKEPALRFQSAADLAYSLRTLSIASISTQPGPTPRPARRITAIAPVTTAVVLIRFAALWSLRPWQPDLAEYRFIPFATEDYPEYGPAWSPDGSSIAYSSIVDNEFRILVKGVDGGLPTVLARHPMPSSNVNNVVGNVSWSADGSRLFYVFLLQGWSVARTGGTPEPLKLGDLNSRVRSLAAAPDGTGLAIDRGVVSGNRVLFSLWFSPLNGSPPVKITDAGGRALSDLAWAPDSSQLLASRSTGGGVEMLLIRRNGTARPLLEGEKQRMLYSAWLPDSRHALITSYPSNPGIRLVDTRSGQVRAVLPSATTVGAISASRDSKVATTMGTSRASIMQIPLDGALPHPFLYSRANNSQLAWSPDGAEFSYVYEEEIRIRNRAGTVERSVVSHRDFPNHHGPLHFEKPSFSPDGQRLLYTIFGVQGHENGVWISPVNGGAPVAVPQVEGYAPLWTANSASILVNASTGVPNSARAFGGGIWRFRLGGSDQPEQIYSGACDPALSPDGKWMLCPAGQDGLTLVSLESKDSRVLTSERMVTGAFSRDGSSIYAIRPASEKQELVRVDVATGTIQTISTLPLDFLIGGPYGGPTRLALAPDGKSVFTTVRKVEGDIWILDGFNPPRRFWDSLWR